MHAISSALAEIDTKLSLTEGTNKTLRELDCIVMDNSLRESTVGALRGHTLENKWKIYNEVKKCGFDHIIVAAFSHNTRVDDHFVRQLVAQENDRSRFFSFAEGWDSVSKGIPDSDAIPVALKKMKEVGLQNPIIEIDLADSRIDWKVFNQKKINELLLQRIEWSKTNLSSSAKILVNFRDFTSAMNQPSGAERVISVTHYLGSLPIGKKPYGLMFEEPTGKEFPETVGTWTAAVRKVMNAAGWRQGHLLVHVHEKWGLAEAVQLVCLANGANGVWASVCIEGAALGHACSSVSVLNLIRLGNKKVLERYNCTELRSAAINVTELTRGVSPHPKQPVYGERALDMAFDFGGISGGRVSDSDFDLAKFFGEPAPKRISTLASADMVLERLKDIFGDLEIFTQSIAENMKVVMIEDLTKNRKEEYMSPMGLAVLFDRAGGSLNEQMRNVIEAVELNNVHHKSLIGEVRKMWDEWDLRESTDLQGDDCLEFDSFYNGFMAPYFGCFRCDDTRKGLAAIDMDDDGHVEWSEFSLYLKWALHEYPDLPNADELLSITFRRGIIPAMQDELLSTRNETII